MLDYYRTVAKDNPSKTKKRVSFGTEKVPGEWKFGSDFPGTTAYWLNVAHRVSASGSFMICCNKQNICNFEDVHVHWQWHDDIDAHDFKQALNTYEAIVKDGIEWWRKPSLSFWLSAEGMWDIIGDKVLDTDFRVIINWLDTTTTGYIVIGVE